MVRITLSAKVSEKGQIVIPKPIRDRLNIQRNEELVFDLEDRGIVIKKKRSSLEVFEDYVNALKKKKTLPKKIGWDKEHYSQFA